MGAGLGLIKLGTKIKPLKKATPTDTLSNKDTPKCALLVLLR